MHSRPSFENPAALPHEVVAETIERALRDRSAEGEAASALVGIALNDDDAEFIEHWCVQVGTRAVSGSPLLGLAGLCLGHTARRFGQLSDEALALAESLAARAEADPADVDGRAQDGYDDVRSFLHLW
ncbi:hypothetical protein SAMN02982929_03161 [Saccharopolyspora kobensis]|uniref:Uncharacterized protein n=1 Tax=Saccharopolyspora kobensis TaxID=146035 RepID=A0A1H6C646_9PSEU|nr:hypothetical protein [Saccharopolyspora kobensis]SEG68441.1 hypothetical protein SAMN02982929_03161 [Saccharopolyspora kobensis]SFC29866.1 hypothetical protein SAMN05216506_101401 [Saccharopolyspora kobensis]